MALSVLVTGANGFIGSALVQYLEEAGHKVIPATRAEVGSINADTDWFELLQGVDVVVHTAARVHVLHEKVADPMSEFRITNVYATMNLAEQAAANGVKRFIFLSTIGVLGNYSMHPLHEDDEVNPSNAYSASKWEAEQGLIELADKGVIETVIIRPPLVYGVGVKANFYRLMKAVDKGWPMPFGRVRNKRDFVSKRNLCGLIATCLDHPQAKNQTFLVSDDKQISTPDLIAMLAFLMAKKAWLIPLPVRLVHLAAKLLRKERLYHSICNSLRVDCSKAKNLLGWQPEQSMDDGLKKTVDWYRESVYDSRDK